jgi:eukaryotic-like serine/threonine-protein kinase
VPEQVNALTKLCGTCGYRLEASLLRCPGDGTRLGRERPEAAVLGAYRLAERLGTGGMGVVYRAVHQKLGRTVAIKVLNRSLLSDRTNIARFFQEARSVNTIRHPNVVDIYDFVTAGKDIYTVMEFLVGQDLHHALYAEGGRPFAVERAVAILEQICMGLQAAHERNIIHRDLKPANVFLARRDRNDEFVKLLDFGLAKLERSDGRMTRDGVVLGTPEYMAPEQARDAPLDGRTDLYGVGCLAYHMLSGSQLFAGGAYGDVMVRHVKEEPPPLRAINNDVPVALEQAVMRCLAKEPEARPSSALAVAQQLTAAIGRTMDSVATRPRVLAPAEPAPSLSLVISRTLQLHKPGRRKAALGILGAGLLTALVSVVVQPRDDVAAPLRAGMAQALGPGLERLVTVKLQSQPPGATVVDEKGRSRGVTPLELLVPLNTQRAFDFVLPGYQTAHKEIWATLNTNVAEVLKPVQPAQHEVEKPRKRAPRRAAAAPTDRDLDSKARTLNPFER